MGPSRTPRRTKGQDEHWENIGVRGRKTGVTLKAGVRDENGLESIDGIFSSPEKSPAKPNGLDQFSTISEGETMDIGQSTNLDPTEVIGRARNVKNLLPPRSRSPIKTNIGSSPRRSLGPVSSPSRVLNGATPTRTMSHPPESSNFDLSREELTLSINDSDMKGRKPDIKHMKKLQVNGKGKKRAFDLSMASESDEDERNSTIISVANETNGDGFDESALVDNEDGAPQTLPEDGSQIGEQDLPLGGSEGEITEAIPETTAIVKKGRGRPRKAVPTDPSAPQMLPEDGSQIEEQDLPLGGSEGETTEVIPETTATVKKGRGRPRKAVPTDPSASQNATSEQKQVYERPSKKAKKDVDVDVDSDVAQAGSLEAETAADLGANKVTSRKRKDPKTAGSERDPNVKMKPPARPTAKSLPTKRKGSRTEKGRPKLASLFVVRSETPADENGALRMKSGRTSIKPVKFWQGERIVYGDGNIEGAVVTLPGIKEVIRTDEIPRPQRPISRRRRPKRQVKVEPKEEEEEDEREPWETETGSVRAQVMQWDPVIGKYDEENTEETDIAYAAEAIEMRDISGAEFRFAKTLTLPFFGSGIVELPPGGAKRVKNSRKMQMVFFVFYGRVTVDVGTPTTSFSIGKGGMWQVPRGNFYSITNLSPDNSARLFFAQGCEVNPEMAFDDSAAA